MWVWHYDGDIVREDVDGFGGMMISLLRYWAVMFLVLLAVSLWETWEYRESQ